MLKKVRKVVRKVVGAWAAESPPGQHPGGDALGWPASVPTCAGVGWPATCPGHSPTVKPPRARYRGACQITLPLASNSVRALSAVLVLAPVVVAPSTARGSAALS